MGDLAAGIEPLARGLGHVVQAASDRLLEGLDVFRPKQLTHHPIREEKITLDRLPIAGRRPATAGNEQVQVRMAAQISAPGVQRRDDADAGAQMLKEP